MLRIQKYIFNPVNDQIGLGSFGVVYKGKHEIENIQVAIKTIGTSVQCMKPEQFKKLVSQYEIIKNVKGQGVVKTLDFGTIQWAKNKLKYAIVQQLMEGDLQKLFEQKIEGRTYQKLTQLQAQIWIKKIVKCYDDIHKSNIIHRDIKPQNILFKKGQNDTLIFKLADFGYVIFDNCFSKDCKIGTQGFRAPEVMTSKKYNYKVDIFSIGCVLFYLLSGNTIQDLNIVEIANHHKVNQELLLENLKKLDVSENAKNFIIRCLDNQPLTRFTWDQLVNHIFIRTEHDIIVQQAQEKISKLFAQHDIGQNWMHANNIGLEAVHMSILVRELDKRRFMQTINTIQISDNIISPAGIKILFPQNSSRFCQLKSLFAQCCQLGRQGVEVLAHHHFPNLYDLNISGNNINDGIRHIFQAGNNFPSLKLIDLRYNAITQNQIDLLRTKNLKFPNKNACVAIFKGNQITDSQINRKKLSYIFVQASRVC